MWPISFTLASSLAEALVLGCASVNRSCEISM